MDNFMIAMLERSDKRDFLKEQIELLKEDQDFNHFVRFVDMCGIKFTSIDEALNAWDQFNGRSANKGSAPTQ